MVTAAMKLKDPCSLEEKLWPTYKKKKKSYDQQHIKKQRHYFTNKGPSSQSYGFSSGKESWVLKNQCFWTVVLKKTLESPLDCKEIQLVNPKGNQSWVFIGRTEAEAETPILWPPDAKNWLIWKDPDAGKDWRQEKGMTEDEMVGWHQQLNGHEFEQAPEVGDGQGSLAYCSPWGCKELDTTERLNWTEAMVNYWTIGFLERTGSVLKLGGTGYDLEARAVPSSVTVRLCDLGKIDSFFWSFQRGVQNHGSAQHKCPCTSLTLFRPLCSKPPPFCQHFYLNHPSLASSFLAPVLSCSVASLQPHGL